MLHKSFGRLRAETDEQRAIQAKVTEADVEELRARMAELDTVGQVLTPEGLLVTTSPATTRALMSAGVTDSGVVGGFMAWLEGQIQ